LPTQKQLSLADLEATEAIRTRLLLPIKAAISPEAPEALCSFCGATATLGHEDTCKGASRRWIARHNAIIRALTRALASRATLQVEEEPLAGPAASSLRADFAISLGTSRYYYDVQVVALTKESAKDDPYSTLAEAAAAKRQKYSALGAFFKPLIFSAGGLMEKETAKAYKELQQLLSPVAASWLDASIALALTKTRASSAASIARESPKTKEASWLAFRQQLRQQKATSLSYSL
jgi:hypothetical protein